MMFILNNIHGREHQKIYGKAGGESLAIFDITEKQINHAKNAEWNEMNVGDLVCIISSSYNMSTIYQIDSIDSFEGDKEYGKTFLLRGHVVAKFPEQLDYTETLSKYHVKHKYLNNYQFTTGFNVANLGAQLDSVVIKSNMPANTLGELKEILNA